MPGKVGIIAGSGELPRMIIQACQRTDRPHFVIALQGYADPAQIGDAPQAWYRPGRAGTIIRHLQQVGAEEVVLVGGVARPTVTQWLPDLRTLRFIFGRRIWRLGDGGVLNAMIDTMENDDGLRVVGAESVAPELLAALGPVGRVKPDEAAERDIALGLVEALTLGRRDLGQGVVVRAGSVLEREDQHGTDALLARCRPVGPGVHGSDMRSGVLVKMARPTQDRRVDLPAVGVRTVEGAAKAGLAGIAVEAGGALIIDHAAVAAAADRLGLFVVGIAKEQVARGSPRGRVMGAA